MAGSGAIEGLRFRILDRDGPRLLAHKDVSTCCAGGRWYIGVILRPGSQRLRKMALS